MNSSGTISNSEEPSPKTSNIVEIVNVTLNSELGEQISVAIISPDILSSPPNLASPLLPVIYFTFNLALMWLLVVHGPLHPPATNGALPTVTNEGQLNRWGMGLEIMVHQDGI